jgi:Na+/alanine symporter
MTFPNLIAIILLSGMLKKMSKDYFSIKHPEYKIPKKNIEEK